jgi:plasmid stabilization system protein ParE
MNLAWTHAALDDLKSARANGSSPAEASLGLRQVAYILVAVESLPRTYASIPPGHQDDPRELRVQNTPYIVSYRVTEGAIEILRVLPES